ncbi:glycosyltransferase [uncultured Parabacteroides sp.]|uniref:glycosyltransferase n=1 Tax=uncultured Parabacteroides sp. TaxID=512312 RepID=UPI00259B8AA8|nr:glycosyltransferase [uncultured Parabacteroides sp.]
MENHDFIITSLQSWDIEIGSTIKNTTLEISKANRVLYVNPPLDHMTWFRGEETKSYKRRMEVIEKRVPPLRRINSNLWVVDCPFMVYSINRLPFNWLFDLFNYINNKKIADQILKSAQELGFNNYIHLIDTDIYRSQYLKELIKPSLSIYYCRDFVIGRDYWKKNGTRLEPLLAAKSDMVLVNSTYFAKRFKEYNPNTYPIETGVNLSLYDITQQWAIPEDIQQIPYPIIGYTGSINSVRLDSDLLFKLAQQRPDYSFVFVGPEDNVFSQHPLHQLKNVYFLGKKKIDLLPAYIMAFDVCINPQLLNEITDGNYPLKIDEYLAMGKPTVATQTHTMNDIFREYTFLPHNETEYLKALDSAVSEIKDEQKKEARIAFAHTHSWENSVKKIYQLINKFV